MGVFAVIGPIQQISEFFSSLKDELWLNKHCDEKQSQ